MSNDANPGNLQKNISFNADGGQLATLLGVITEAVIVRTGEKIVYMNDAAMALLGVDGKLEDLESSEMRSFVHPDDREILKTYYSERISGGEAPSQYEFRILRSDGGLVWVSCQASRILWEGQPSAVACLTDISAQRKIEKQQNKSERLFQYVFNLVPDVMLLTNLKDGRIVDVNPSFLNVFGLRRDDVIGQTSDDLGIWADATFLNRFVEELKMTTSMMDVPATVRTRGNVIRHFQLFAQKIEYGIQPLLLLIGRDVTEDLIQAQELQKSKDNAELANRAKSAFLANMSHELRTPLNGILGFAEIIRDQMIGPMGNGRYAEYAGDIHSSGTHLLHIINDILDLSKVEAGQLGAHFTWIDPIGCLESCLTLVHQRAFESNITVEHELDEAVLIEADERLVKQIGINLLSNSVKYTEPGGQVTMTLARTANGGVCLSVADTGIGMSPEEVKIARRPFGQVESHLSKKNEGSGLGLPLVNTFAEKLSATMTIESQTGVGTRVNITFPPFKVKEKEADAADTGGDI
ncbi:MAG: PAS domain S-box protein [Kordiimonas sp.]